MGPDVVFIRVTDGDKNIPLGKKKKSENQKKPQSIIRSSLHSEIVSYHRGGELKSLTDEQQMN